MPRVASPIQSGVPSRTTVIVAALYLGLVLWAMRVVLPAPATLLPQPGYLDKFWSISSRSDQDFVAWGVARNARTLVTNPRALFQANQCYPVDDAMTFGEHMFGEGLLGVVPYLLTGDPLFTYNAVVILTYWIAALAMYALVRYWTASAGAAFVAGLVFAFHPARFMDPVHLYAEGNHWTPLALLFAHRLFVTARWRDACLLSLFVSLQLLESFYQVLGLVLVGGVYGGYLLLRNIRRVPRLLPQLLFCAVTVAAVAAFVLGPYLRTRATWEVLSGRALGLLLANAYDFGQPHYPGTALVVLAVIAVLDRVRGPRRTNGEDPRFAYFAAALFVGLTAVWGVHLPWPRIYVPSPFLLLREVLPGLDAIRATNRVALGIYVGGALLAGYGVLALTERLRPLLRTVVVGAIIAAVLWEAFSPEAAARAFGARTEMVAYDARPVPDVLALYDEAGDGAILDFPLDFGMGTLSQGHYALLSAFHHRPIGSCYNSFIVPVQHDVEALAKRFPDPEALEALYALGFRTIVLHEERMPYPRKLDPAVRASVESGPDRTRLVRLGYAIKHRMFRLESPAPVEASFAALRPGEEAAPDEVVGGRVVPLEFVFRNAGGAAYRHPAPVRPTPVHVRWQDAAGTVVSESDARLLLPLALGRDASLSRRLDVAVPGGVGAHRVVLTLADEPSRVIAQRDVRLVTPPTAGP